jgi:glycosyltransferase involved in cell wall biosynthesis
MARDLDIICFSSRFGLADYSISLAKGMMPERRVRMVTSSPLDDRYRDFGGELVLPFRRARHYLVDIWRFLWRYLQNGSRVLIFQSWLLLPGFESIVVALIRMRGNKLFVTVHDTLPHHPRPWSRFTVGLFYRQFDGLIAHSEASAAELKELGVVAPIYVIPHATQDIYLRNEVSSIEARDRLSIPRASVVYLFFGHIDSRKGCFEFLEVARRCVDVPNAHFVIAGRNELTRADTALIMQARELPNVTFVDGFIPVDQVQLYFAACDVVAIPYREGTTSGVYRLAVAFDRPVIASEVGDLRDAIARGTAYSLGTGNEVVPRFEQFVRTHHQGIALTMAEPIRRIRLERQSNTWTSAARQYLAFIDATVAGEEL